MLLQIAEGLQTVALVLADPALVDFVDGDGIEVVEFFAAVPDHGDEVGAFQQVQVLGHGLAGHRQVRAEPGKGLAVFLVEQVEKFSPSPVSEGFEDLIHCRTGHGG